MADNDLITTDPNAIDTELRPKERAGKGMVGPSPNAATNLLIADVVLRGASSLFRKRVEDGMVKTSDDEEQAREIVDGRGIITTLALYGASKLATRSPVGLGIVAGGLVLKTLYDRGKALEKAKKRAKRG